MDFARCDKLDRVMLFRQQFLDGIRDGSITVAYRRWRRPSVRTGGTLLTAIGQLGIASVSRVPIDEISNADARRAGYESREALLAELDQHADGDVYRIDLGPLRADPRIALRQTAPSAAPDRAALLEGLRRLDARSAEGPWTRRTLELVRSHPAVRAADLCLLMKQDKERFKLNVRKLKTLGLTESLDIGYRLSARGNAVLRWLEEDE